MAAAFAAIPLRVKVRVKVRRRDPLRRSAAGGHHMLVDGGGGGGEDDGAGWLKKRNLQALLGADEAAWRQILSSPEGKRLATMDLHTCALRIVRLRDALPVADVDVCAMVVEQPSLVAFEEDYDAVGWHVPLLCTYS